MGKFKIGDIVRLKDSKDYFYKVVKSSNFIIGDDNSEKVLDCEFLDRINHSYFMESQMQKVTFYEMLEYIKDRCMRLSINNPNWVILNCLIDFTSGVTEGISYTYDNSDDIVTLYYNVNFISNNLYIYFDNLDFKKDYMNYKINKELDKCVDILKDTFINYLIYDNDITKDEFLKKALEKETPKVEIKPFVPKISYYSNWKPNYMNMFDIDKEPKCVIVAGPIRTGKTKTLKEMYMENMKEDKMTKEEWGKYLDKLFGEMGVEMAKPEPKEDKVYINVKNNTTVIRWADGDTTKVTYDPKDEYKKSLEKGVLICALRKYMTTGEINKELKWSHTNEDMELGMLVALVKQYFTVDKLNELINKAMESQERDLKKYRKKSNKEVKETLSTKSKKKKDLPF